jgi:two-component system, LytTR family, response regulator
MEVFTRLPDLARWPSTRMAIKVKGKILLINPSEVVAVLAEGNYVLLEQESISYLLRESISVVAENLEPFGFIRIHRSALVNSAFVEEIKRYPTGEYGLRVKGGKEYMVTRTYKENLKSLAGFWIGTGTFLSNRGQ